MREWAAGRQREAGRRPLSCQNQEGKEQEGGREGYRGGEERGVPPAAGQLGRNRKQPQLPGGANICQGR